MLKLRTQANAMDATDLLNRCRNAAAFAVRGTYGQSDRDECATDIYGDIVTLVANGTARTPRRSEGLTGTARDRDILRYIDAVQASEAMRLTATMPLESDDRVSLTALINRARDWRRKRDADREHTSMSGGAAENHAAEQRDTAVFQRAAKLMRETDTADASQAAAERATERACESLRLPHRSTQGNRSDTFCALYPFIRGCDGPTASRELKIEYGAYRDRRERGAKLLRDSGTVGELMLATVGAPVGHAGIADRNRAGRKAPAWTAEYRDWHYTFALRDDSREARNATPMLKRDERDGTASHRDADGTLVNVWPARAESAQDARDACKVRKGRPAPAAAAKRRAQALAELTDRYGRKLAVQGMSGDELKVEAEARARRALGRAIARQTGRMGKHETGRTAGRELTQYSSIRGTFHHDTRP